MTLGKEGILEIALCGGLVSEDIMDLQYGGYGMSEWMHA